MIVFAFSFAVANCTNVELLENKKSKSLIQIHYKSRADKSFSVLQQYDEFRLGNSGVVPVAHRIIIDSGLSRTIDVGIDKPSLLLIGFNEFYIEPGDTLDLYFSILKKTKEEYKDSIHLNSGRGFFFKNDVETFLYDYFSKQPKLLNNKQKVDSFLNYSALINLTNLLISKYYPNLSFAEQSPEFRLVQEYYMQKGLVQLLVAYKQALKSGRKELTSYIITKLTKLTIEVGHTLTTRHWMYWIGLQKLYELAFDNGFKTSSFSSYHLLNETKQFDSFSRQYLLLIAAKRNLASLFETSVRDSLLRVVQLVNIDKLRPYKKDIHFEDSASLKFDLNFAKLEFYNAAMQKKTLQSLFDSTRQPFLILDFCGTWCIPCLQEITKYKKKSKLDNSNLVRPVWIFFENNTSAWLQTVKKLHLDKDNCFLVADNKLISDYFSNTFYWKQEFPHHFLFRRNGSIIDGNSKPLDAFDVESLSKFK